MVPAVGNYLVGHRFVVGSAVCTPLAVGNCLVDRRFLVAGSLAGVNMLEVGNPFIGNSPEVGPVLLLSEQISSPLSHLVHSVPWP